MRDKQRVVRIKEKLRKQKNKLLIDLYQMKDQQLVCSRAKEELGMVPLKPSQVVTVTFVDEDECNLQKGLNTTCTVRV